MWVQSLGWEDPLEKEMAACSSILAWKIPWTEEPGGLQSVGLQRVRHDWAHQLLRVIDKMIPLWESFPGSSVGKESACNAGDPSSIPGSGRSNREGIGYPLQCSWVSLVAQLVKNLPAILWGSACNWTQETWVQSPGLGRSPREGNGYPLQYSDLENSMGSQTAGHDWATFTHFMGEQFPENGECSNLVPEVWSLGIERLDLSHILPSSFRRRQWHPTPVLLPGKSHGRRGLVGCSPWGR